MNDSVSPAAYNRQTRTNMWTRARDWVPAEAKKVVDTERQWIKPEIDSTYPLRTMLLDDNNPLPLHRTQAGLRKSLNHLNRAHHSYDVDGDGVVSLTDYKIAREMDADNSGIIDEEEHIMGREKLARQFYEEANNYTHRNKLTHRTIQRKSHELATVDEKKFGRMYQQKKRKLWIKESRGGMDVINCLHYVGWNKDLQAPYKHKEVPDSRVISARTQTLRPCASIDELRQSRKQNFVQYEENKRKEVAHLDKFRFPTGRRFGQVAFAANLHRLNGLHMMPYAKHSMDKIVSARLKQKGLV